MLVFPKKSEMRLSKVVHYSKKMALVLAGAYQKNYLVAMLATIGVVLGAAYMLWLTKRVIFGKTNNLTFVCLYRNFIYNIYHFF